MDYDDVYSLDLTFEYANLGAKVEITVNAYLFIWEMCWLRVENTDKIIIKRSSKIGKEKCVINKRQY